MNTSIGGYSSSGGNARTSSESSEQSEGRIARSIEKQTAKMPSDWFLWMAGAAMLGSLGLELFGRPSRSSGIAGMLGRGVVTRAPLATFVGQWVPTLLLFGIYNKIVKVAGSDRRDRGVV